MHSSRIDLFDVVDNCPAHRPFPAIEPDEQQHWDRSHGNCRIICHLRYARRAFLRIADNSTDLGQSGHVEQQDRATIVRQGRPGIDTRSHNGRRGRLYDELLMIVDPVDREREHIVAG